VGADTVIVGHELGAVADGEAMSESENVTLPEV